MACGIMCQLLAWSSKLHISNKYTVVNQRLKTIAELTGWLFEGMKEIYSEDNRALCDREHPYLICFDGCEVIIVNWILQLVCMLYLPLVRVKLSPMPVFFLERQQSVKCCSHKDENYSWQLKNSLMQISSRCLVCNLQWIKGQLPMNSLQWAIPDSSHYAVKNSLRLCRKGCCRALFKKIQTHQTRWHPGVSAAKPGEVSEVLTQRETTRST